MGHLHATETVMHVAARRNALVKNLKELVSLELVCHSGPPAPENVAHVKAVINYTMLRSQTVVRARAGDELTFRERGKTLKLNSAGFEKMVNGRIWLQTCEHWCCGCCQDEHGVTQRSIQVDNFVAAVIGFGLLGGYSRKEPAKSRWLSSSASLAALLLGILVHSLLPRVWRKTFGE